VSIRPDIFLSGLVEVALHGQAQGDITMSRTIIDDGFRADLVEEAIFAGKMEIPTIRRPAKYIIPDGIVPFSCRKRTDGHGQFLAFYEHDIKFNDVIVYTDHHLEEFRKFAGIITPDCSLYRDMPLCLQIANTYMNRAIGQYLQKSGLYVVPNVRWSDERTYSTCVLPEKVAFLGVEKYSIVSIGTYGCIQGKENSYHFRSGLIAMLDELEPEIVLVYGSMPERIFGGLETRTRFVQYPDWITSVKRR